MTSTITPFRNHLPVQVEFGEGAALNLPGLLERMGATRVSLMIDAGLERHNEPVAQVLSALHACSTVTILEKASGEPTISVVDRAAHQLSGADSQVVLALGGGSVIDTAKAARLCAQLSLSFTEFLDEPRGYPEPAVPLIAVPTTAGTGSEVSGGAVVSDPTRSTKSGIAHARLRPQYAVVDPQLTWSMPPTMTANTGIDALAQAIAAVVAKVHTPVGDAIALEAVRLIGASLVAAFRDGSDAVARSRMACGAMMAGLAMNISDCTAEHALGQAIGGLTGAPHGLTVGLVLAETLERESQYVPDRLERVADALGVPDNGERDGSRTVSAIRDLLADLEFPVLSDLKLTPQHLGPLTEAALADYFITMSPQPWAARDVRAVFESALFAVSREPVSRGGGQ